MVRLGGGGSTDYTQPLAGGASLSITIPNDISSSSNTTINVANRPSGAIYTFAFPTPVPVINKSKTTSSNLQADGNLSVATSPTPCVIDDAHSSCQLVFNPTGAVNGTYQITPHYAAAGTVTKADTALNSFNVSVSGQPVQELAPFIVSTYSNNTEQDIGPIYAYKNGALENVMTVSSDNGYHIWFANVNNKPIYMVSIYSIATNSDVAYKYSYDGYNWQDGDTFSCGTNQIAYEEVYQGRINNQIMGYCYDNTSNQIVSMYNTTDGKSWNKIWQDTGNNSMPVSCMMARCQMLFIDGRYMLWAQDSNLSLYALNLTTQQWENQNINTSEFPAISVPFNSTTNGTGLLIWFCDGQGCHVYQSSDLGKTWLIEPTNEYVQDLTYDNYLKRYYSYEGTAYSIDGITWNYITPNVDLFLQGYNPQLGYIAQKDCQRTQTSNCNAIYSSSRLQNNELNVNLLVSLPNNLQIDNIVVGY